MTKLVTWNNRDEDKKNANSLLQRRFRCHRLRLVLRSLLYDGDGYENGT